MKAAIKGPMTLVTRTEAGQLSLEAVPASHRGPVIIIVVGYRNFPETWSVPTRDGSAVGLPAVGDLEHQHHQLTVLEIADQAVVAYPIAPQAGEVGGQGLAALPGVFCL